MNRFKRWGWAGALAGLAAVLAVGCGPSHLWHLLKGDQKMEPAHPLTPPEGKAAVTVAVSVSAGPGVPVGADLDLAGKIGGQLKALSAENKDTAVEVIDQNKVQGLRMKDPHQWQVGNGGEFAKKLAADYWIEVTIHSLTLVDRELGGEVCRGKAVLDVAVYEAGQAEPKYTYQHTSVAQLKPSDPAQVNVYRTQYLGQVATEIAFNHVKYKMDQKRALEK